LFDKFRRRSAASRLLEEQLYEQVVLELSNGQKRAGLWAKALANGDGIEEKAKSLYLQYRVQSIKDEMEIAAAIAEEMRSKTENIDTDKSRSPSFERDYPHSFEYKNKTIKNNFIIYWVEGKSFNSAKEAKEFIDNQA
jgi:hypothetical protein